jgi:TolB-like protein/tetratricopeptide (TPR) repeat protein
MGLSRPIEPLRPKQADCSGRVAGTIMDGDRRRKVRQLFDQAQDLEPEVLGLFLDQACIEDPDLRREVESILERDRRSRGPDGGTEPEEAAEATAQERAPSLVIGQQIGRYRVVGELGEGGMGEVFLARDLELRRDVALKVLPARIAEDPVGLQRFKREARALAAVDHPNIVTIHSVEEEEGLTFLTMERVEGDSLDQVIPENGLETAELVSIASSVTDALAVAHAKGITHRDLKPANIMVGEGGRVKILDFGLAKLRPEPAAAEPSQLPTRSLTLMGIAMGTVPYMSPEQVEGKAVDQRSDLFSLGIVLYEMATGRRPFAGDSAPAVMSAVLKDTPAPARELNARVPWSLERIIGRCLEKSPERRPQSAREVTEALELVQAESAARWPFSWLAALPATSAGALRRKLGWIAAGALGVAVTTALVWYLTADRATIRSLAVLPLENYSQDAGQDYFVDGMTEALITDLAKVGALKVISRTSAMQYRDSDKPLPQIARELGVDAVVEGSVTRAGEQVRISVQLIRAETDEHLWADSYDRELSDILSLQSEVARGIAGQIEAQLTPAEERLLTAKRPVVPEAYDAYLRGLFHLTSLTPDQVERARDYFEQALEKDPSFALAYAGLAETWGGRVQWGGLPPAEGMPKVRELALKAIELDDTLAEAHNVLAKVSYYGDWDWSAAEMGFQRAVELNPNSAFVRHTYALLLASLKRHEEAMEQIDRALELDPLNLGLRAVRGWQLMTSGRFDEAIATFRETLAAGPVVPAQLALWTALRAEGRYDEAWVEGKKAFSLLGRLEVVEAMDSGYAESGYRGAMHAAAERLAEQSEQEYIPQTLVARLYAHAEEKDQVMHWLEKAYEERDTFLVNLGAAPDWDDLRAEPRFRDLLARIGLPE